MKKVETKDNMEKKIVHIVEKKSWQQQKNVNIVESFWKNKKVFSRNIIQCQKD